MDCPIHVKFGRKLFVRIPVFLFCTKSFVMYEEFEYKILYSVFVKTKDMR